MKNEITYQIPQEEIKKFLNLDNQKFQELKKQVGITTNESLNLNNLKTLISFSSRLDENIPGLNKFDLKPFEVDENNLVEQSIIKDIPEAKKIKIYKEKKTKLPKPQKVEKQKEIPIKKTKINGRRKRTFTHDEDKKILDYYNSDYYKYRKVEKKKPYSSRDLAADLKVKDKKIIAQRASELGFTNFVNPKDGNEYCEEELKILKENVGRCTTKKIQQLLKEAGYLKSIVSINVKITRLSLSLKLDGSGDLTLTLLSKALGVDTHVITDNKKIMAFLEPEKTKKEWIFSREKVRNFIIQNPYELNFGKIDNKFLVDLLVGTLC